MTRRLRLIRDSLRSRELALNAAAAVLGGYLAVGNILHGAKVPDSQFWTAWQVPFVILVVAALYVPLFALYKGIDAWFGERDRLTTAVDRDLLLYCQQVVAEISESCPNLALSEFAAQIWLCRPDETFDQRVRFFLPHLRNRSGVSWSKGKGVAGVAWATDRDLAADLTPLHGLRRALGTVKFDELPVDKRYGMTSSEVEATEAYTGIVARRLFSTDASPTLRGIFIIDYTGQGQFPCIVAATKDWRVRQYLGACEERLSEPGYSVDSDLTMHQT